MASSNGKGFLMPTDMLYLLTFGLGMLGFWLGGKAGQLVPALPNATIAMFAGMAATGVVYGLIMFILAFIVTRQKILATLAATFISIILGVAAAQIIFRLFAGQAQSTQAVGILIFGLYLCYGSIYVLSLAVARKIAKSRAA